jgi:hypothetical protein
MDAEQQIIRSGHALLALCCVSGGTCTGVAMAVITCYGGGEVTAAALRDGVRFMRGKRAHSPFAALGEPTRRSPENSSKKLLK